MRKKILGFGLFLTVFVFVASSCLGASGKPSSTPTPTVLTQEPFCEKVERTKIDFSVLNEVVGLINRHSAFQKDTSNELLFRGAMERVFGFLSVPKSEIPQWAKDIVEEELKRAKTFREMPDFSVLNRIFVKLSEDPQYQDLKDPTQLENLLEASINGIKETLGDPFSSYINREEYILKTFNIMGITGSFEGLGVILRTNDRGEIMIDGVNSGTPAERAGLKIGDIIFEVNNKSTKNCTLTQFRIELKSLENPELKIKIRRFITGEGQYKELDISLVKGQIKQNFVSSCPAVTLPNGRGDTSENFPYNCPILDRDGKIVDDILMIKIDAFNEQQVEDLRIILESLDLSKFKGIIIDLKGNPGGAVTATETSLDFFLEDLDQVLYIFREEIDGTNIYVKIDKEDLVPSNIPVVVIVDKHSASGSEKFAGSLRDNGRAVIFGKDERTTGKGTTNILLPLRGGEYGGLYIATGIWLTPNGEWVEKQDLDKDGVFEIGGLKPDIKVDWTDEDYTENGRNPDYDPTLFEAIKWIRSKVR